jgi:galactoside O-acetyltransferase
MKIIGDGSKIYPTAKIVEEGREIIIGRNCFIGDFAFVAARKLVMEDGSQISPHAIISGGGEVYLGKFSVIGFNAVLIPATDSPTAKYMCESKPEEERQIIRGSIRIGEGAYIGSGAVICVSKKSPNIEIGDYAVIGALSYIDKSIPPNTVVHPLIKYQTKVRRIA